MPTDTDASQGNLKQATQDLNLTAQEQFLYQTHLNNLWGSGGQDNEDGSRSTLYQSVQEHDGKYYNIPTIWNGNREAEPWVNDEGKTFDVPNATALKNVDQVGWDKFPSYADPEEADSRYMAMHSYMEKDTSDYMDVAGYPGTD